MLKCPLVVILYGYKTIAFSCVYAMGFYVYLAFGWCSMSYTCMQCIRHNYAKSKIDVDIFDLNGLSLDFIFLMLIGS